MDTSSIDDISSIRLTVEDFEYVEDVVVSEPVLGNVMDISDVTSDNNSSWNNISFFISSLLNSFSASSTSKRSSGDIPDVDLQDALEDNPLVVYVAFIVLICLGFKLYLDSLQSSRISKQRKRKRFVSRETKDSSYNATSSSLHSDSVEISRSCSPSNSSIITRLTLNDILNKLEKFHIDLCDYCKNNLPDLFRDVNSAELLGLGYLSGQCRNIICPSSTVIEAIGRKILFNIEQYKECVKWLESDINLKDVFNYNIKYASKFEECIIRLLKGYEEAIELKKLYVKFLHSNQYMYCRLVEDCHHTLQNMALLYDKCRDRGHLAPLSQGRLRKGEISVENGRHKTFSNSCTTDYMQNIYSHMHGVNADGGNPPVVPPNPVSCIPKPLSSESLVASDISSSSLSVESMPQCSNRRAARLMNQHILVSKLKRSIALYLFLEEGFEYDEDSSIFLQEIDSDFTDSGDDRMKGAEKYAAFPFPMNNSNFKSEFYGDGAGTSDSDANMYDGVSGGIPNGHTDSVGFQMGSMGMNLDSNSESDEEPTVRRVTPSGSSQWKGEDYMHRYMQTFSSPFVAARRERRSNSLTSSGSVSGHSSISSRRASNSQASSHSKLSSVVHTTNENCITINNRCKNKAGYVHCMKLLLRLCAEVEELESEKNVENKDDTLRTEQGVASLPNKSASSPLNSSSKSVLPSGLHNSSFHSRSSLSTPKPPSNFNSHSIPKDASLRKLHVYGLNEDINRIRLEVQHRQDACRNRSVFLLKELDEQSALFKASCSTLKSKVCKLQSELDGAMCKRWESDISLFWSIFFMCVVAVFTVRLYNLQLHQASELVLSLWTKLEFLCKLNKSSKHMQPDLTSKEYHHFMTGEEIVPELGVKMLQNRSVLSFLDDVANQWSAYAANATSASYDAATDNFHWVKLTQPILSSWGSFFLAFARNFAIDVFRSTVRSMLTLLNKLHDSSLYTTLHDIHSEKLTEVLYCIMLNLLPASACIFILHYFRLKRLRNIFLLYNLAITFFSHQTLVLSLFHKFDGAWLVGLILVMLQYALYLGDDSTKWNVLVNWSQKGVSTLMLSGSRNEGGYINVVEDDFVSNFEPQSCALEHYSRPTTSGYVSKIMSLTQCRITRTSVASPNITHFSSIDCRKFLLYIVLPIVCVLLASIWACDPVFVSQGIPLSQYPDNVTTRLMSVLHIYYVALCYVYSKVAMFVYIMCIHR